MTDTAEFKKERSRILYKYSKQIQFQIKTVRGWWQKNQHKITLLLINSPFFYFRMSREAKKLNCQNTSTLEKVETSFYTTGYEACRISLFTHHNLQVASINVKFTDDEEVQDIGSREDLFKVYFALICPFIHLVCHTVYHMIYLYILHTPCNTHQYFLCSSRMLIRQ